jgi:hypothetical protein
MKEFGKLARGMALSMVAAVALGSMTGCTRIETGSVGILKHFGGQISSEAQTGVVLTILDSIIGDVDVTETRVPINNLRPADAKGNQLEDLDVVLSFRLNGEKVPGFYINTKEIDHYKDESGRDITTVGLNVVKNLASHAINEVTKTHQMSTLAGGIPKYEDEIKLQVQKELDAGYPGVFQIVRVNVNNIRLPEAVARQASSMANLEMENDRLDKELSLTAKRETMAKQSALIDAKALRAAADETKLTPEQVTAWKNAKSYADQAAAMGAKATPIIDAKGPAPK